MTKNKEKNTLRTNRRGKYLSVKFKDFSSRQLTIALTPKLNGISKHKTCMVLDGAQSMSQ